MDGNALSVQQPPQSNPITGRAGYFANAVQDEALARVRYMASHRHRLGLLLGGSGSGKSMVLQILAQELTRQGHLAVTCSLLGRENIEFLSTLATGLGHFPDERDSCVSLWRAINDRLRENKYQQRTTVILLDDADEAEMDVLTSITRLAQTDAMLAATYTVIVSAHSARCQLLGPRLKDLCELRVELEAWGLEEVARYVEYHIRANPRFEQDAVRTLLQLTDCRDGSCNWPSFRYSRERIVTESTPTRLNRPIES
ncbi:MAG: AAA family ATPase [Planctomycetota bacterium]|nr:AAA family ATPase [Planctomycetota bacterium]